MSLRSVLGPIADRITGSLPRPIATRVNSLRRDLSSVARQVRGARVVPVVSRRPSPQEVRHLYATRRVVVSRVVEETHDTKSFVLTDPTGRSFEWSAGQYFTLVAEIDGQACKRAYSGSSSPRDGASVTLTCKRVPNGVVSAFLHDRVAPGHVLDLLGPSGSFGLSAGAEASGPHIFIAGGSGVTPVVCMIRELLETRPSAIVGLIVANRSFRDIIFREEFERLKALHAERFRLRYVLEEAHAELSATVGRLDATTAEGELAALGLGSPSATYYLCGPEPMMRAVMEALSARSVPPTSIRRETFFAPSHARESESKESLEIIYRSAKQGAVRARGGPAETLLETGLRAAVPMPFSCAVGGCASCKCRLVKGAVRMDEPNCLTAAEREEGYVLACVAHPTESCEVEVP